MITYVVAPRPHDNLRYCGAGSARCLPNDQAELGEVK